MEVRKRKLEDNLRTLGLCLLVLELWTVIKVALMLTLNWKDFFGALPPELVPITQGVIWSLVAVDVVIHCFVCLSARAEGKGRPKGMAYVVLAWVLIAVMVGGVGLDLATLIRGEYGVVYQAVTTLVDVCVLGFLLDLAISAWRLKKLRKVLAAQGGSHEF